MLQILNGYVGAGSPRPSPQVGESFRGGATQPVSGKETGAECSGRVPPPVSQTGELTQGRSRSNPSNGGKLVRTYATVVTFYPHPQEYFSGERLALLTPPDEKVILLSAMGVEQLVLLPFDRELAELSPTEFVEKILVQQLQASHISVGHDFQFGHRRTGTAADLAAIAATYGVEVLIVPLQTSGSERISSSAIRQALHDGDLATANGLLGRPYSLVGQVVQGQQLGRTLGFPTANLHLPTNKLLPKHGVYAVRLIGGCTGDNPPVLGVMNIGCRPTVDGDRPTVEVHLLDWSGDLYGQTLTVALEQYLRPEQKFASLDALKEQIQADCATAKTLLALYGRPHK